jgi:predicted transcriptional regulator
MWLWLWPFDESQQTVVIAILGFIVAFLLTHYFFSFRRHSTIRDSNSYNELIESLLSQNSAKFAATTKIIEGISLRLELLERALEQTKLGSKSEVGLKSEDRLDNLSLLSSVNTSNQDIRNQDISDITKSHRRLHDIDANSYHNDRDDDDDVTNMTGIVLKLLSQRSMNTVEIQSKVNRTREHTSRFMKRLFVQGLVSREMNAKPFVYTLTDEGHKQLKVFRNGV